MAKNACEPLRPHSEPIAASRRSETQSATGRLLARQRVLLRLLEAFGGAVGNTDFQKLLFLYCQEPSSGQPYDFVPYRFGAFSFTSYADRRKLVERGLLADDEAWVLTAAGREAVMSASGGAEIDAFARRWSPQRGDALVAETYRRFPYYAIRSEIATQVLRGDDTALDTIEAARPSQRATGLCTIGYEGRSLERYLNALLQTGATVLCDVRRNPISRKYGFSRSTLSRACEGVGIRYEHLPELGIESTRRRGLDSQAGYEALFADYVRDDLPRQTAALRRIEGWILAGECVALTCYEELSHQCHRHCVADALTERSGDTVVARHL